MSTCKIFHQDIWKNHPDLKDWVKPVPSDPKLAYCRYCYAQIFLSILVQQALFSHTKGKSTQRIKRSSSQVQVFFQPKKSTGILSSSPSESHASVSSAEVSPSVCVLPSTNRPSGLEEFLL